MKVAPEPVMSEVVRQRLELLLSEAQPRHAAQPEALPRRDGRARGSPAGVDAPAATGAADQDPVDGAAGSPRRLALPDGGLADAGRRALEFTREHLTAVVLVLLVGCGWTAWSLLQVRSTPVAVAAAPTVVAGPTPTASAAARLLVHVIGAVRRPGVVELAEGSRVADAIAAAGGLTGRADPAELNLAAMVTDGAQLVIGTATRPHGELRGSGGGGAGGGGAVSLNGATLEQLDTLPGVGPVTAERILQWREQHGRFTSVEELQEVEGIGPKTFANLVPHVRL